MYLKHENIVYNSTILIAYSSLGHTAELVGTCTEYKLVVSWVYFYKYFASYKSAILDLSVLFKVNYPVIFAQTIQ